VRERIESIEREYRRYKKLAEGTFEQLADFELAHAAGPDGNSVAVLVWHISGNLESRFTEFLTTDGEKPWRQRDSEFAARQVTQAALRAKWEDGWSVLFGTLATLSDSDLERLVTIRGDPMPVRAVLHMSLAHASYHVGQIVLLMSLAHASYHVGQIVLLGKSLRGSSWRTLTIPRVRGQEQPVRDVAEAIRAEVEQASAIFGGWGESDVSRPRGDGKWTRKEILGHLIDSAANNHQRFVRAQLNSPFVSRGYDQMAWVEVQAYRARPWRELVELWCALNRHLAAAIEAVPADRLSALTIVSDTEERSLEWWMQDYLRHLRHHLEQIERE
jgi:hypothetical protein